MLSANRASNPQVPLLCRRPLCALLAPSAEKHKNHHHTETQSWNIFHPTRRCKNMTDSGFSSMTSNQSAPTSESRTNKLPPYGDVTASCESSTKQTNAGIPKPCAYPSFPQRYFDVFLFMIFLRQYYRPIICLYLKPFNYTLNFRKVQETIDICRHFTVIVLTLNSTRLGVSGFVRKRMPLELNCPII